MTDGSDAAVAIEVQFAWTNDAVPSRSEIECWIRSTVTAAQVNEPVEVSVRIVDEAESRNMNRRYRGRDHATNVLSFPVGDAEFPPGVRRPLGDIVVCGTVVQRESAEQGKSSADHWAHMLVHGTLHLLGFDHEIDTDAAKMESLETRILAAGGLGDPYAA